MASAAGPESARTTRKRWAYWRRRSRASACETATSSSTVRITGLPAMASQHTGQRLSAAARYHACRVSTEGERDFSPSEAEALLPELDALLRRARSLLSQLEQQARREPVGGTVNGYVHRNGAPEPPAASDLPSQLRGVIADIQRRGVIVRDVRSGLIDF